MTTILETKASSFDICFGLLLKATALCMGKSVVYQLQYETDSWKRMLEFISRENGFLLDQLSNLIKEEVEKEYIINAEYFQSAFIEEDQRVRALRQEIFQLESILRLECASRGTDSKTRSYFSDLKLRIIAEEDRFAGLRQSFQGYLDSFMD